MSDEQVACEKSAYRRRYGVVAAGWDAGIRAVGRRHGPAGIFAVELLENRPMEDPLDQLNRSTCGPSEARGLAEFNVIENRHMRLLIPTDLGISASGRLDSRVQPVSAVRPST
jgi:hypothetical protein